MTLQAKNEAEPVAADAEPAIETKTDPRLKSLIEILSYRRPSYSKTERRMIGKYIWPLGARPDRAGNMWLQIPRKDGTASSVLWSCHTDTVHDKGGLQHMVVRNGLIYASDVQSSCLGADCSTGVWLMTEMIKADVPGTYVFHRGEEVGGKGSGHVALDTPEKLAGFKYAIAFDRKGYTSVITEQFGGECCSQAFVNSIVPMLPPTYKADPTGTFTDTENYAEIIPECSNLSVGYFNQHTYNESQDFVFALELADAMCAFDEDQLVCARDPKADRAWWRNSDGYGRYRYSYKGKSDDKFAYEQSPWNADRLDDWANQVASSATEATAAANDDGDDTANDERGKSGRTPFRGGKTLDRLFDEGDVGARPQLTMQQLVRQYPDEIADILEQMGYSVSDLVDEIEQTYRL